jgi:Rrf2 family protein
MNFLVKSSIPVEFAFRRARMVRNMRTLSKKTQYSLRALYSLARSYGRGPILISRLAAEESIPQEFLENILLHLKRKGLVESKKGKGGGYLLARRPEAITLGTVIRLVEGPIAPLPCASETDFRKCDECLDDRFCGTRMVMRRVRDAMAEILDRTSLAQVCGMEDDARAEAAANDHMVLMYYI